jgi:3-methylfumaryl-CoA hydratase
VTLHLTADDIGVAATTTSELSVEHARRVTAVLDADDDLYVGSPVPLLWHWMFFTPAVPTARLGQDGHPGLPGDGPTAGLPRRVWAGGRVQLREPLVLGTPSIRRSRVVSAERKSGRSGDLLIVTAAHELEQGGRVVLTEEQDLIYRAASTVPTAAPVGDEVPDTPAGGWRDRVTIGPAMLFRYSAVTFNSHRIHYDVGYATNEEGYPDVVVHGPLTATMLAESARRRGRVGSSFSFRASAPLFAGLPFSLVGEVDGDGFALQAVRNDGAVSMTATLM